MYWICYDFTRKLVRGLCLGIAIGLFLTVVVPWIFDLGFVFVGKVQESDLALPDLNKMGSDFTANLPSWNDTTKNFWRVDQGSNDNGNSGNSKSHSFLRHKPSPTPAPTPASLWRQLGLGEAVPSQVRVAVNQAFAALDQPLQPGDVVAFLPPISGG